MAEAEGSVLEFSLRRLRVKKEVGVWGLRRIDGKWEVVEMAKAAGVVNPVVQEVTRQMEAQGLKIEWVQETLRHEVHAAVSKRVH